MNRTPCLISLWICLASLCTANLGSPAWAGEEEDIRELYRQGMEALEQRLTRRAEQFFVRCIAIDSTHYDANVSLAWIRVADNDLTRAESLLRKAIRLDPERPRAPFHLSKVVGRLGRLEEAYSLLHRVLELEPESAGAWMGVGSMRMRANQMMELEEAEDAFSRVRALDPANQEAVLNLGDVFMQQGKLAEAIECYRDVLSEKPTNFRTRHRLGMALYLKGDFETAASELRRAAEGSPRNPVGRWSLYLAYKQLGGYPDDLDDAHRLPFPQKAPESGAIGFVDVGAETGAAKWDGGMGSAWADYDGDGDLDLFATGAYEANALFRNDGGEGFVDRAKAAGLDGEWGLGSVFADYDNDGDPDLYLTRKGWWGKGKNSLYANGGDESFVDVAHEAGVEDGGSSFGATWGDIDNDGYVDLVVTNGVTGGESRNRLFLNDEGKLFEDIAAAAGIMPGRTIGSALGDYDNDGDLDLYLAHFVALNSFYRNDTDGTTGTVRFSDVTRQTRTQLPVQGYFAFFFDYDNDGYLDLFCSQMSAYEAVADSRIRGGTLHNVNRPALYHNEGDGRYADVTYRAGLGHAYGSTGAAHGDFDNDGHLDIYLANGGAETGRLEPDALLRNRGDGTFVDIAARIGMEQLEKGHGVTLADYDGDGDQDIYVPIGGFFPGERRHNRLLRNDTEGHNWVTLSLVGSLSNRDGIGARVRVRAGARNYHHVVSGGGGFGVNDSRQLEIGLGEADSIEEAEVRWPSGRVEVFTGLSVNNRHMLVEGSSRGQ